VAQADYGLESLVYDINLQGRIMRFVLIASENFTRIRFLIKKIQYKIEMKIGRILFHNFNYIWILNRSRRNNLSNNFETTGNVAKVPVVAK